MTIAQLNDGLRRLVVERELLRDNGASWTELERNRLEIVFRQQELSHALIAFHFSQSLPQAA